LLVHIMSFYLYCIMSAHWMISAYLYDACSLVWCLLTCFLSAVPSVPSYYLCDICLLALCQPILCLPICVMTVLWNDVCLTVHMMPAYL
jgi:hypothetical protein